MLLHSKTIETPVGSMLAIANDDKIYLLEYIDRSTIHSIIKRLEKITKSFITSGDTHPIVSMQHELELYFKGKLTSFKTPLHYVGTPFQQRVWQALQQIPYGETRSYADIALSISHPLAYRAVARANATNHIPIVIPCHRVINANGKMGGYSGGLSRKEFLLRHEKN